MHALDRRLAAQTATRRSEHVSGQPRKVHFHGWRQKNIENVPSLLRAVTMCDVDALMMLEALLLEWSSERRGVNRIVYPRLPARDAFVAIPCAIRDAPDAALRPDRDDRVVLTRPFTTS